MPRLRQRRQPCSACKFQRRSCVTECLPFFPAKDSARFATVHTVFGVTNVRRMLENMDVGQRGARARQQDPVYGITGRIRTVEDELAECKAALAAAKAALDDAKSALAAAAAAAANADHSQPEIRMDDPNPGNSSEKDHPSLPMDDPNPGNSSGKGTACHPSLPRNEEGSI